MDSLRGQLVRWLLAPVLLMLAIAGLGAYFIIHEPATTAYDQALADGALALSQHVRLNPDGIVLDFPRQAEQVLRTDRYDNIYFTVFGPDGGFVAGDPGLPRPLQGATTEDGRIVYDATYRGRPIRAVALLHDIGGHRVTLIVAETTNKRRRVALDIAFGMLVPEFLLALGLAGAVWFGVSRGLAPLGRLRQEIQSRSHLDLRPLDDRYALQEVRPLVVEINKLLERLKEAGEAQRRFTANAAHQLRTPLAGLQTQLELALQETVPDVKRLRLEQCHSATLRTARLVQQLLALSAAEPGARGNESLGEVNLPELLQATASLWVHRAAERDIDFGLDLAPARVQGDSVLLGELVANLVDNALAYTPRGGRVTVRCGTAGRHACLSVADSGPGIPEAAREQILERFVRLPGTSGPGSGLGLAIVREIAHRHGASVEITDTTGEPHGTTVTIRFAYDGGD